MKTEQEISNMTHDEHEKTMREMIRERGYLDSLSPSALSGRYADASVRYYDAVKAAQKAKDVIRELLAEFERRFPREGK
jgi:hypothetical protein